jgi:hypothetical protein
VTTLLLLGTGYLVLLTGALAVVIVAKRADENMGRERRPRGRGVEADHAALGRVAVEVCEALHAERVTVVLSDPDEPTTGVIRASFGAPGLLGSRVPVAPTSASGVLGASDASMLGLVREAGSQAWRFVRVPIEGTGDVVGAITAASRSRSFAAADLTLIEHVARGAAPQFDRRRHPRAPDARGIPAWREL